MWNLRMLVSFHSFKIDCVLVLFLSCDKFLFRLFTVEIEAAVCVCVQLCMYESNAYYYMSCRVKHRKFRVYIINDSLLV